MWFIWWIGERHGRTAPPFPDLEVLAASVKLRVDAWSTESVSTSRLSRSTSPISMCSSWKPRQVPQIGKGSPLSFDSLAQLKSVRAVQR